ncbi:nucleotide exchange factor GrpE [Sneathiella chinensis]|uniref:Protein GrpE n=1 Tax=Sneathiella chinensis TaxID=349750 RepID=A0ABQ5U1W4_9PROT|nr:nucleotide exchange factor GrpE [Sneathiella chinensis]GLQ05268.1 protein GrpE [Sneathiella chinensis]
MSTTNSQKNAETNGNLENEDALNREELNQEDLDAGAAEALSEAEKTNGGDAAEQSAENAQAEEIASLKEKLLRAMAEVENTRRRAEKDKEDAHNYAVTKFARDMLEVSDNLRRALDSIPAEAREDEAVKNLTTGVEMTESGLLNVFKKHKVERIDAEGKKFDPHLHQAMFEIENPDVEPGTVLQVVQSGYVIADRLLRPAMVGVAKGGQKKKAVHVDETA